MRWNILRYAAITVLPLALYFGSTFYYTEMYHRQSLEWMKLCYEHNQESSVCSEAATAGNRAFSFSSTLYQPTLLMLIVALMGIAGGNMQMRKELNELKERLDA